jgi:glycosyltransferase involved in cell wall biosynthesis
MRLAIIASHPIQYYAPLFRTLARRIEIKVFFAHRATAADQADAGFGVNFDWDSDLLSGYEHAFLPNVAREPRLDSFRGCDTPTIGKELASGRFDAVLIHGWHLKSFVQAGIAAKRLRLPLLVRGDSHLDTPRSALKRVVKAVAYPPLLRFFDAALYVGQRSRAYWTHYHYPASRLFFSPHCVDAEWFAQRATREAREQLRSRLGISHDANVLLFAGKLLPFKRADDLVRAAAELNRRGRQTTVLIAGAGPTQALVAATARDAEVALHLLGFRNQTEMPAAYAAADLLVMPSEHETWGLVANEALACGKPVILADSVGCAPDLAADGIAGRVFAVGNVAALTAAISQIVASPPSPAQIAAKSTAYGLAAGAEGIVAAAEWTKSGRSYRSHSTRPTAGNRFPAG